MANQSHKKKYAKKMMTPLEIKSHVPPFSSIGWMQHSRAVQRRVERKQGLAHAKAVVRRGNLKDPEYKESFKIVQKEQARRKKVLEANAKGKRI